FFPFSLHILHLPSFPTRRSSDLAIPASSINRRVSRCVALSPRGAFCLSNLCPSIVFKRRFYKLKMTACLLNNPIQTACSCGHFEDRKSTRLNSSHVEISYAVFCL